MRKKSLSYSKTRKKQPKQREEELELTIANLEEELDKVNLLLTKMKNAHPEEFINAQKRDLEKIIEDRTK